MIRVWNCETPAGALGIVRTDDERWGFVFDGVLWDVCDTPEAMLDNIRHHLTGCDIWDASGSDVPADLNDWERC